MSAQLIEASPIEPLVVGVHLYPGDTWFREIRVVSTTSQEPVDLSAWAFEARLGAATGVVDASRAAEGILSVTFGPSVTASAKRGTQLTIAGTLGGGRRTFVVGRVGAEVGSSIPVGLVQRKHVVMTDVDISVYAAPRGDKGLDGASVSPALVKRAEDAAAEAEEDADRAGTSAFNAGSSAASARASVSGARDARDEAGVHRAAAEAARAATEAAARNQVHEQTVPSASWVIPHTLGRMPVVAIYVGGQEVDADVTATSTTVSIAFAAPVAGTAVLT